MYVCRALPSSIHPTSSFHRISAYLYRRYRHKHMYNHSHTFAIVCRVAHIKYDFPRDGKYIFLILCILACVENVFRYISWGVEWDTCTYRWASISICWHKLAYTQGEYFICENLKNVISHWLEGTKSFLQSHWIFNVFFSTPYHRTRRRSVVWICVCVCVFHA